MLVASIVICNVVNDRDGKVTVCPAAGPRTGAELLGDGTTAVEAQA